jgi:voltage-gated potassium channel
VRLAALARGTSLVRVVSSLNRGMAALGGLLGRRGFGYVAAITILVTLGGAAGMYAFEHAVAGSPITGYWAAVWWTAMVMTTMGSDYFPHTMQGRVLCVLLAVYAFTVFGYVTATLATFFVDREAASPQSDIPDQKAIEALQREVAGLRTEIRALMAASQGPGGAGAPPAY